MTDSFELGPIRPPSEAYSLLIRTTRNCPWNRCKFCPTYKGEKFQLRSVDEIKKDIEAAEAIEAEIKELSWKLGFGGRVREAALAVLANPPDHAFNNVALWMHAGGESAFLQDANSLIMKTADLVEVLRFLKETFPGVKRVTCYARSKTAARKTLEEMEALRRAGLSRLHIGLESGYDPLLELMDKGVTAAEHIEAGRKVVESGISLCEYVLLGLGGQAMWREHAVETARVLNEINPDFIRVRTLTVNERMPLHEEVEGGRFVRATDEGIVGEERLLIERLECRSNYVSDHITNLLQEVEGRLPGDKEKMLAVIDRFQSLPAGERLGFTVGRRMGIYTYLDDMSDSRRRDMVERAMKQLAADGSQMQPEALYALMKGFI
ncbi:MAG: radical SAM protein [Chloroflexi bacterium]|nr:radical SAM protein [Chloroflexota bacterium]